MKINLRKSIITICCFFILLYPFNSTIADKIYPTNTIKILSIIFSIFLLFLLSRNKKNVKYIVIIVFVTAAIIFIEAFDNQYLSKVKFVLFTVYLFIPLAVSCNEDCISSFKKCLNIFSIEHIIFTFMPIIMRNTYVKYILPFLDSAQSESLAISHFNSGFNPGLTTHYSTNGMYLAIISIYMFSQLLKERNLKNLILLIISIIALLMTGKRGHAIFTILAFVIMFFVVNKDKVPKKVFKFSIGLVCAFIFLYIISSIVPQVTIIFERFTKSIESGTDLLTGRGDFYDLAIKLWKENILFGNGWGSFSNYYQIYLFSSFGVSYLDAHNVYIQLLCETGIVGSFFIICIMICTLYISIKNISKIEDNRIMHIFSFGYQAFFLLYCFSGNPLYDPQCYVMYFVSIGIALNEYAVKKLKANKSIL